MRCHVVWWKIACVLEQVFAHVFLEAVGSSEMENFYQTALGYFPYQKMTVFIVTTLEISHLGDDSIFFFCESMCAASVLNPIEVVYRATFEGVTTISYILFPLWQCGWYVTDSRLS
jgi:hypothetical protein